MTDDRALAGVNPGADEVTFLADGSGCIVEASPGLQRIYGYACDEVIGRVMSDLRASGAVPRYYLSSGSGDSGGVVYAIEHRRKDGSIFPAEVRAQMIERNDGQFLCVKIRELDGIPGNAGREMLFSLVFENCSDAIVVTDANIRIIAVNPAFTRITGYEAGEVIGQNPRVLSSGRQGPEFYQEMWAALRDRGVWEGEIWNRRKNGEIYPEREVITAVRDGSGRVVNYIAIFCDISERKKAEQRIAHLAHYDSLTGLPNRALMQDRLSHALAVARRDGSRIAVMFVDLDRFKLVNDTLGHHVGDMLLKDVAGRLTACTRRSDTVSRTGGDEFVVGLEDVCDQSAAAHVAENILKGLASPFQLQDHEIRVTPSIGIAIYPDDGQDLATLLKHADMAMYQAKEAGRNAYRFFCKEMNSSVSEKMRLENALQGALARDELALYYQPQFDLHTNRIVGMEALLRWDSPEFGSILPENFIPIAEETRLILPIGEWALREACGQMAQWRRKEDVDVPVAVNISAIQLGDPGFQGMVERMLSELGLPPQALELECTEGVMMADAATVIGQISALKRLGVQLSIDDFGAGYSSLACLKRFSVDKLKIDRSFVNDLGSGGAAQEIVKAIIAMARSLGLCVVAEGVESNGQRAVLSSLDCECVQGHLYCPPLPAAAVVEFWQDWPRQRLPCMASVAGARRVLRIAS